MLNRRSLRALAFAGLFAACGDEQPLTPDASFGPSATRSAKIAGAKQGTGELTIVLDTRPDDPADVQFAASGPRLRDFILDDDAEPARSSSRTFTRLKPGTYTVREQQAAVGTLAGIACVSAGGSGDDTVDLPAHTATIRLEAGEQVTCTFRVGWADGDAVTYSHEDWGDREGTAGGLLLAHYDEIYPSSVLELGIPGAAGFSMRFFDALAVVEYLPAIGLPNPLVQDYLDPTSTSSGVFGGDVTALELDVAFSDAGLALGAAGVPTGDLVLCAFPTLPALDGLSVREFLGATNTLLGGGSGVYTADQVDPVAAAITRAFPGGSPSQFARDHLFIGACP